MPTLAELVRPYGLELSDAQQVQFETYYRRLVEWNERFNLTTITAYEDVKIKHMLDSLTAAPVLAAADPSHKSLVDVGSGAGFPGLPLAIVFPTLRVTLLEATGKKVTFLHEVARTLELNNVTAVHGRAEEFAHTPAQREHYDFVTARAVAALPTLAEYTLPLARVGGLVIAYKAVDAAAEAQSAENAFSVLGGHLREIIPVTLGGEDAERNLVVIAKIKKTPAQYPRAGGAPRSKPL